MGILQGTFDLAQCAVTIDGLPIDGFGDGDAVTIEYNAPTRAPMPAPTGRAP